MASRSTPMSSSSADMIAGVISDSKRVVSAHTRHFLALSVLFLLPLSSLLIFSPSLLLSLHFPPSSSNPPQSLLRSPPPPFPLSLSLLPLAVLLLSLSATASISHSVQNGFFGRPVKLLSTLSTIPSSLLRLFLTLIPISALFILLSSLLILSFKFLPPLFIPHSSVSAVLLLYLSINWSLAFPIAVLESTWGVEPLRRSADRIKGLRLAAGCLYLFFLAGLGLILWGFSVGKIRVAGDWSGAVLIVARTILGSAVTVVMLLYWMVSAVVMYMYCKALHGELAAEIAEEFAWEYVSLPFDEQKVPRVVSVVRR